MQRQTERLSSKHTEETCFPLLQQASERVNQVLGKAATDLTTHGPDVANHATLEHAHKATEQIAV